MMGIANRYEIAYAEERFPLTVSTFLIASSLTLPQSTWMYPYETHVCTAMNPAPSTTAAIFPTCLIVYPLQYPTTEPKEIFAMIGFAFSIAIAMGSEEDFSISFFSGIVAEDNFFSLSGSIMAISRFIRTAVACGGLECDDTNTFVQNENQKQKEG